MRAGSDDGLEKAAVERPILSPAAISPPGVHLP
jgi:hypothetical protein